MLANSNQFKDDGNKVLFSKLTSLPLVQPSGFFSLTCYGGDSHVSSRRFHIPKCQNALAAVNIFLKVVGLYIGKFNLTTITDRNVVLLSIGHV